VDGGRPPVEAAEIAALPDGPGKALVTERCLLCHGAGLLAQQRKDAAAWGRTVTQMRAWERPYRTKIRPRSSRISPSISVRAACDADGAPPAVAEALDEAATQRARGASAKSSGSSRRQSGRWPPAAVDD
jgi:hypothetical protein